MIFDLSGVDYVNSAGLRELVQMWERVQQKDGKLLFVNRTDRVRELLEIVGLDTVFEIHNSMPQLALSPSISAGISLRGLAQRRTERQHFPRAQ